VQSNGLGQVAFAQAGRADQKTSRRWRMNWPAGQFIELLTANAGVEAPVKALQAFAVAEAGQLAAFVQEPLAADLSSSCRISSGTARGAADGLGLLQAEVQAG